MKVATLLGSGMLFFAVAAAAHAADAVPTVPSATPPPAHKTVGQPLPEKYAKKFGDGASGAQAAWRVLRNTGAGRDAISEALDALTYYGHDGAMAVTSFAFDQLRKDRRNFAAIGAWNPAIVEAMGKVPDSGSVPVLVNWAQFNEDPRVRIAAMKALSVIVANVEYEVPLGGGAGRTVHVSSMATHQEWRSLGRSIDLEIFGVVKGLVPRIQPTEQTSADERNAWKTLSWWVTDREEKDRMAVERFRAIRNGEAPNDGGGYGGFGTPPAAQ